MKKSIFVTTLMAAFCCLFCFSAFAGEQVDIQKIFKENRKLFLKKSNVIQRFSSDWIKTDVKDVPSYTNSLNADEIKDEKVFVQFFGRHGFRVGTKTNVLEVYYSNFYFYCYILKNQKEGVFYIDEQGSGGYVVPDTSGPVYLDYWNGYPGFVFNKKPMTFFRLMNREEMDDFNATVVKFIHSAQLINQKNKMQKLRVISQPALDF